MDQSTVHRFSKIALAAVKHWFPDAVSSSNLRIIT
jgi:hypothetical protein